MQELRINKEVDTELFPTLKAPFWKRQFQAQSTRPQKIFDWILGVILPVICFAFDPLIFKSKGLALPFFGAYKPFAYLLSFVSVMAMAAWLIWGAKLKWLNGFLAGLFFAGAIVSLCVGLVLFPFSLIGIFLLIGFLGFTPLFSAFIYWRNGVRAIRVSKPFIEKSVLIYSVAYGALFSAVVPMVVSLEIKNSLENIKKGDAPAVDAEFLKLKMFAPLVSTERIILTYRETSGGEKKLAIAGLYKEMTGDDIENEIQRRTYRDLHPSGTCIFNKKIYSAAVSKK